MSASGPEAAVGQVNPPEGMRTATSEDALLGGRVRLRQPVAGFRAAIDPVFLAAAIPAAAEESVLDLGCGVGAASLCLLARQAGIRVTGLEIDGDLVKLAEANAHLNGVAGRFLAIHGDVAKPPPRLAPGTFHHVMCNPPFLPAGVSKPSALPSRDAAMREGAAVLADWVRLALIMARPQGSITLIHRADRLDAILATLSGQAGDISVYPLWPGAGKPAKRVIIRARKGVAAPVCLCPGMILHQPDGGFTAAAEALLRDAAALRF